MSVQQWFKQLQEGKDEYIECITKTICFFYSFITSRYRKDFLLCGYQDFLDVMLQEHAWNKNTSNVFQRSSILLRWIHRQIKQQTVLNFHGLFFSFLCRHFRIWEYLVFYRLSVMMELWIFELFFGVFSGFCRIHIHRNPFLWDNNSTFNKQVPTRLPILDVLEDSEVL